MHESESVIQMLGISHSSRLHGIAKYYPVKEGCPSTGASAKGVQMIFRTVLICGALSVKALNGKSFLPWKQNNLIELCPLEVDPFTLIFHSSDYAGAGMNAVCCVILFVCMLVVHIYI